MSRLQGKVAIITGAARGQGAAEADLFATAGASVMVTDVEDGSAIAEKLGSRAAFAKLDVSSEADWKRVIEETVARFGHVDTLVNNAAVYKPATMLETDTDLMDLHYRVNQLGAFLGMKLATEAMIAGGHGGSIVNISSGAAQRGSPAMFAYSATKWALRGMSRGAAATLAPHGIRVNCIFPGVIDTPILANNDPAVLDFMIARIPMKRMGQSSEVAEAALFLASDEASYITGAELNVCGGTLA